MALVPCKVCGSLNSDQEEICLSCGHPTQGKKRPLIFQIAAIVIVLAFVAPALLSAISWIKLQLKPSPRQQQERISFIQARNVAIALSDLTIVSSNRPLGKHR